VCCTFIYAAADALNQDAAAGEANRQQLVGLLDEAEQQLATSPYLAGQAYSVADVIFTPVLFRLGMAGKTGEYLKPRPNVSEYYNRCVGDVCSGVCLLQEPVQGLHATLHMMGPCCFVPSMPCCAAILV
jgi:hypothetical protein